jgi:hypothetical protein
MAIQIQFRRGFATEWTTINPILAEGEMGIETDSELFKIGNGLLNWNDLPYGGIQGPQGDTGLQGLVGDGNIAVDNVLYVSKSGNDSNDGLNLSSSKLTIKAALSIATSGTTIFVKSGDYTENNPLVMPPRVSIVGDNLRTVTVRPTNPTQDLFWVKNGCYLEQMTFKDHKAPAAAVAFPPDGSAGVIFASPYVQNCTSMTTTGTGMRVDGDHVNGLKSMVVDAYTQFNQGGIGIHMLNRGNTQLVSVFTICCDIGFLCESGGFCSVTNSNSSFGNFALMSDGVSTSLYSGKTKGNNSGRIITIDNLVVKPNVGDAVKFAGSEEYYTVSSSTAFTSGGTEIVNPSFSQEAAGLRNARSILLDGKSKIQVLTIEFLNLTYPNLNFNQFKCSRDVGLIINAVADDLVLNTNYKSRLAGISYYRASASQVISAQLTETIAAIEFVKTKALALLSVNYQPTDVEYLRAVENFNIILAGLDEIITELVFNNPTGVLSRISDSTAILRANKDFLIEEGIAFIAENFPLLTYNQSKCREDIAFIVDAVTYDVLYDGNSQTADAADEYYSAGTLQISVSEKQATIDTFNYIKTVASNCVTNTLVTPLNTVVTQNTSITTTATETESLLVENLFDIVSNIIENAYKSIVTLEESAPAVTDDTVVTFHQYSLITASGHTFEFVGSGTNVNTALPYLGGVPITENQAVDDNGGKIFFTGTDQRGDFRIGKDFVINQNTGTISGRTFTRSLFAVMTPYILAIGDK